MATSPTNLPYFISWANQSSPLTFEVDSVTQYHYLNKDQKILDYLSTSYQASFGLKNSKIEKAIIDQTKSMSIASPKAIFPLKERVSHSLLSLLNKNHGKIFYTVSGSEAVENALKIARQFSGRKTVAARYNCYHGATLGAVSVTGDWRHQNHFVVDDYTLRIPDPKDDPTGDKCLTVLKQYGPEKIAALIIETTTGANGVYQTTQQWVDKVTPFLKQNGILLILDEIVCAFGRTGKAMGFHHLEIQPDLICMAKAMTGGFFPMGSVWVNQIISDYYNQNVLSCGLTNYAHPIGLKCSETVIDFLKDPQFFKDIERKIQIFENGLNQIKGQCNVTEIRNHGLLAAIDGPFQIKPSEAYKENIHLQVKSNQLILSPALTMTDELIEEGLSTIQKLISRNS